MAIHVPNASFELAPSREYSAAYLRFDRDVFSERQEFEAIAARQVCDGTDGALLPEQARTQKRRNL
jgi:hypothetical protein